LVPPSLIFFSFTRWQMCLLRLMTCTHCSDTHRF
jgi:hypothetical protein